MKVKVYCKAFRTRKILVLGHGNVEDNFNGFSRYVVRPMRPYKLKAFRF